MKLLLATKNKGKIAELCSLLSGLSYEIEGLDVIDDDFEVEESGSRFAENARLKAIGYAKHFEMHAIADDSGLEVAALDGRPGVYSARYGGESMNYVTKIKMLLEEINATRSTDRSARFVSHIAFASPEGEILFEAEGICEGTIAYEPKGTNGFGYDPVFIPDGFQNSFGELSDEVKQNISHRSRATAKIMRYLRDFA